MVGLVFHSKNLICVRYLYHQHVNIFSTEQACKNKKKKLKSCEFRFSLDLYFTLIMVMKVTKKWKNTVTSLGLKKTLSRYSLFLKPC